MKLRCLAVDDEPLALELLKDNINKIPFLELLGSCRNGFDVIRFLQEQPVDLVFLDIQMPGLNGVQLAEVIRGKTMVVFLTAYDQYALDGFNVNAVDYLVKPVSFERFLQAATKALEIQQLRQNKPTELIPATVPTPPSTTAENKFIYVYVEYNLIKIAIDDILRIEGYKDYVKIHLQSVARPVITRVSMKQLEDKLHPFNFMRVHKSFIVPVQKIDAVQKNFLKMSGNAEVPVSDNYKEALMQRISSINVLL